MQHMGRFRRIRDNSGLKSCHSMFRGCLMSHTNNTESQSKTTTLKGPLWHPTTGHEHSIEHWIAVRMMVEDPKRKQS